MSPPARKPSSKPAKQTAAKTPPARKPKAAAPRSAWGDDVTQYFFELSPERVLEAVESAGYACTGLCYALNSYENRVYDVEIEPDDSPAASGLDLAQPRRRIVKFYRPGRWSCEQIGEEHEFIADLMAADIPAVGPLRFGDGSTVRKTPHGNLWYTVFPKVGGRIPDELDGEQLERVGRLLARLHSVGEAKTARHRIHLTPETYGLANLEFLLAGNWIPPDYSKGFERTVREICTLSTDLFRGVRTIRTHGDCHRGNLLWNGKDFFFVDFDDMVVAPPVQDIWLLVPGRDESAVEDRERMLTGYEMMRPFDRGTLRLIEPLRALRMVHFAAWIARRWKDPAFPNAFVEFGSPRYWAELSRDLAEILELIREGY